MPYVLTSEIIYSDVIAGEGTKLVAEMIFRISQDNQNTEVWENLSNHDDLQVMEG